MLEVDAVKASEFSSKKKKDRKFKRVYEGPLREHTMYSVSYDIKVIARLFGVNMAGEGNVSDEMVLSTPKGMYCSFVFEKSWKDKVPSEWMG